MAPPTTLTPVGAASAGTGAITPAKPVIAGGILADDVVIGIGESVADFPTIATNGFVHVDSVSPVVQGTNTRLSVVWRRGDFTAHSWGDSGNHNLGAYIVIRGCKATGNPWNVVSAAVDANLNDSALWTTLTTTAADCLILFLGGWSDNFTTGALSGGTGLGAFTERVDAVTATGNDGAIFCAEAVKAAAGATGTPAATLTGTAFKALMTLALEPAAAGGTNHTQTVTDPVGLLDPVEQVTDAARDLADPVAIDDGEASTARTVSLVDWVDLVDALPGEVGPQAHERTVTDPVGLLDSASGQQTASQTATDPVGLTDSVTALLVLQVTITDPVGILDTAAGVQAASRSQSDPVGLLDSATGAQTAARSHTDPAGLLDSQAVFKGLDVVVTDAVTISDPEPRSDVAETLTDPVGLTDQATGAQTTARSQTDPVGLLDSVSVFTGLSVVITDPVGLTDTASRTQAATRTTTDPIGLLDSQAQESSGLIGRTLTSQVGIGDPFAQQAQYSAAPADPIGLLDTASRVLAAAPQLTDPVGILDAASQTSSTARTTTDPLGILDSRDIQAAGPLDKTVTDPLGITDQVTYLKVDITPRWVETDTTTTAVIEADGSGVGLLEPVGAGAGLVEVTAGV